MLEPKASLGRVGAWAWASASRSVFWQMTRIVVGAMISVLLPVWPLLTSK